MMNEIKEGFPLQWPVHWKRIPTNMKKHSAFRQSFASARDVLLHEIKLLGGIYPVISSNIPVKRDGLPYANQKNPEDSGVAVYFSLYGKQQCVPCDKWKSATDNIVAIQKTISALRGIDRWGAKEMVEAAFKGFQALPDYSNNPIITVYDYFKELSNLSDIKNRYLQLAKELHPDHGGKIEDFLEMKKQYDNLKQNV